MLYTAGIGISQGTLLTIWQNICFDRIGCHMTGTCQNVESHQT